MAAVNVAVVSLVGVT